MKSQSNYQDILKIIALVVMIADHSGLFLFPNEFWLRIIGRFVMPILAFYAGYNFKGKIRHMIWLCGIAVITALYFAYGVIWPNILIDLAVGQLYLLYAGRFILSNERTFLYHFLIMLAITPITLIVLDYGTITIAYMMIGFMIANKREDKGHLLLAASSLMLFNMIRFNIDEILPFIFMFFFVSLSSFLLYILPHRASVKYNVHIISRNMLYLYILSTGFLICFASFNY